jgi:TetR/AcrR family transcriptional regulator, cholesterol catabolism regulator
MSAVKRTKESSQHAQSAPTRMLTSNQEERRARIVEAALSLARDGYHAVQIRTIAERSGVARATIYHYFPSKEHLLAACLHQWLNDFQADTATDLVGVADPYDRLLGLLDRLNATLCAMPLFADAVARAYLYTIATVGGMVEDTRTRLSEMLAEAMGAGEITRYHREVGELLTDVWAANVLAVVHRRSTVEQLRHRLQVTVDVIRRSRVADVAPS